jgi:HlyD family secretion protein
MLNKQQDNTYYNSWNNNMPLKQSKVVIYRNRHLTILFLVLLLSGCIGGNSDDSAGMTGHFRETVLETGELEAITASFIIMPQIKWEYGYRFQIIGLAEHGSIVRKGDSIAALDPSSIYKFIIQKEEEFENEIAAANKKKVEMENNLQELQAQLRSELAMYDLKKLELERIRFESELKRKITELEFQQATIRLENVKRKLDSETRQEGIELEIHKIKIMQREAQIREAYETLEKLTLYSPNDGVFQVAQNRRTRQNVRLGDDVFFGGQIASIPDLTRMKALSLVNETDISKISTGMKVIVRLDALPAVEFNGIITFISKICTERERKKVFLTEVEITESDIRLKPGMTVSCEYIISSSRQITDLVSDL